MTVKEFKIPDVRSDDPEDYKHLRRRKRMKDSWKIGIKRQTDGKEEIPFEDGLTWGSIGQIFGYLLGEVDESFQDKLYDQLLEQYKQTDHGKPLNK